MKAPTSGQPSILDILNTSISTDKQVIFSNDEEIGRDSSSKAFLSQYLFWTACDNEVTFLTHSIMCSTQFVIPTNALF